MRQTFHESWFRIAKLKPRLHPSVESYRQFYRNKICYVLHTPLNNDYFKVSEETWHFLGLLNGQRTVDDTWQALQEVKPETTPTQVEIVELFSQLFASNLLQCDSTPDAHGIFNKQRKQFNREVLAKIKGILFIKIPLFDPDLFLNRWNVIFGKFFTKTGALLWLIAILTAGYFLGGNLDKLSQQSTNFLNPSNLHLVFASFICAKLIHEFAHAFSCKQFGKNNGHGGEVHTMGVMLMVFTPMPYVDASSSWAFRSKWQRIMVALAGMYVELFFAALATVVWVYTQEGSLLNTFVFNFMFVASVSTVLFNGNPLLRYDAYYVLSDLIEIPNLAQNGTNYCFYLIKHYIWRIKRIYNPATTFRESLWYIFYFIASKIYKLFIFYIIILVLLEMFFVIGILLAIASLFGLFILPVLKLMKYLCVNGELNRNRSWAIISTMCFFATIIFMLGFLKFPNYIKIEGIIASKKIAIIHNQTPGFLSQHQDNYAKVSPTGQALLRLSNKELENQYRILLNQLEILKLEKKQAIKEPVNYQLISKKIDLTQEKVNFTKTQLKKLTIHAPFKGTWILYAPKSLNSIFIPQGSPIGEVIELNDLKITAIVNQKNSPMLTEELLTSQKIKIEIRNKSNPGRVLSGKISALAKAGIDQLPSTALSINHGGLTDVDLTDPTMLKTTENIFEVTIVPDDQYKDQLRYGARLMIRFRVKPESLFIQAKRYLMQLIQNKLHL